MWGECSVRDRGMWGRVECERQREDLGSGV